MHHLAGVTSAGGGGDRPLEDCPDAERGRQVDCSCWIVFSLVIGKTVVVMWTLSLFRQMPASSPSPTQARGCGPRDPGGGPGWEWQIGRRCGIT